MSLSRREFLQMLAIATAGGANLGSLSMAQASENIYNVPAFGNVSLLHYTDCHAQLKPVYFREPNINLGIGAMLGRPPHLVGNNLIKHFNIAKESPLSYAFTYLDFVEAAKRFGKVGGFAHLSTLVKQLRAQRPGSLLLDGGDTWQGSATSLWTNAQDMVDAQKLLGVDVMTGHWEFTFGADRLQEIIEKDFKDKIDFVAQNVVDNEWGEAIFKPYVIKEINKTPVAIVGQAFPYTPVANPKHKIPDWSFGIREENMQQVVDKARSDGAKVVVVLSHNGMDVDIKMASRVTGIDAILGGHTHDAVPAPLEIKNKSGTTLVINSGSNGKFLSVLDLDVRKGKIQDYRFKLLPVFSNLIKPDPKMADYIEKVRAPFKEKLEEKLAITDDLLYRRGNFNGTFDQLILDAMIEVKDAEIAFSPGFRWGVSVLPGEAITFEQVMTQTAITYPTSTLNEIKGDRIKDILEDIADNLFNLDPYYQQGGDMVRVGGLQYSINPTEKMGKRITDMELNGKAIKANKKYRVAGWASVDRLPEGGKPIWDVVTEYLKQQKRVKISELNIPKIKGVSRNPGFEFG
jgi:sulfur-oxidizing protein SoxB